MPPEALENTTPSDGVTIESVEAELKELLVARDAILESARKATNAAHNPKINKCRAILRYLKQK